MMNGVGNLSINTFQKDIIQWYLTNKRDLPWRKDRDPYKIWISEVMLQQTRVDTVIPYFHKFMKAFPTIFHLAEASLEEVLKLWEGLGYYSRARNLHHTAREVVQKYDGEFPKDAEILGTLKGIGPYTKGAILSIAFNKREPAVDGNVMRVLARILKIEENIDKHRTKKLIYTSAKKLISHDDPSSFNQGLMELGATICIPHQPKCEHCPVQKHCVAYETGMTKILPIRSKIEKQKTIPYVVILAKDDKENYLIEKRPSSGLLADLWQFPMVPIAEVGMDHIENWFFHTYGLKITLGDQLAAFKHVFSHLIWDLTVFDAELVKEERQSSLEFATLEEINLLPFSASQRHIINKINEQQTKEKNSTTNENE